MGWRWDERDPTSFAYTLLQSAVLVGCVQCAAILQQRTGIQLSCLQFSVQLAAVLCACLHRIDSSIASTQLADTATLQLVSGDEQLRLGSVPGVYRDAVRSRHVSVPCRSSHLSDIRFCQERPLRAIAALLYEDMW